MFCSPSKQTTSFLLSEAWIPVSLTLSHTHTHSRRSSPHYMYLCLVLSLPLHLPTLPTPPPLFFLLMFFFSYDGIAAFHMWLTFSPAKARQGEKKVKMHVSSHCLSDSSKSLSLGETAFLQGPLITSIGLPLSARLFPIETCVSQRPSSRFEQNLGG